jgi:two-component system sensor histidine kinase UhpB
LGFSGDVAFWEAADQVTGELLAQLQVGERSGMVFSFPWRYPDQAGEQFVFVAASSPDTENAPAIIGAFSAATLAESTMEPVFADPHAGTGKASGYLVAQDYEIIYRTESASEKFSPQDHPGVVQAFLGERGRNDFQLDGKEYVYAYSPVEPTGWALVIQEPWETVSSPLLNTTLLLPLLILVPVILLAMTVIGFGIRKVLLPLQGLEQKSAELAWGDFESIETPVGGIDEIEHLQNTLIHLAKKIKRSQEGLRGYISAITTGQENERQRLARELHDDTIQALIALNQRVHLALLDLEPCDAYTHLSKIQGLTEGTIQNLRRLTQDLRPQYLEDLGLVPALQVLTQQRDQRADASIDFKVTGDQWRLEPDVELALYRITQEGLNNIIQHAQASHASVQLHYYKNGLRLSIKDDGTGFFVPESPAEFAPQGHFGLLGIYERAEMIDARLEIDSSPGEGTTLTIALGKTA